MRRLLTGLAVAVTVVCGLAAAPGAESRSNGIERVVSLEADLLAAANEARAANGLRPLGVSPGLRAAAVAHSRAMAENGFFEHSSQDGTPFDVRIRRFYPTTRSAFWAVGENLLYTSRALTPADDVKAWLASPGHRRNLLGSQFREAGIGVVRAESAGGVFSSAPTWVVTMDFGARTSSTR